MALKINAVRKHGITALNRNPDQMVKDIDKVEDMLAELPANVEYKAWKRVRVKDSTSGKDIHKMRIVDETTTKEEFILLFMNEAKEFCEHVHRVKTQYQEPRSLKQNLPVHECIIQMDFAENFSCRSMDEVQTAYWHQTGVTLHPTLIYYKQEELKHKSVVIISDEMNHSAATVLSLIDSVVPKVLEIDPEMKKIHYWTDSPSSQYRNRFIFHTVAKHQKMYAISASWNYFEAGHGKGPCDGLGGTTKRLADEAIRQGKTVIQDAKDFYRWSITSSMHQVSFLYIEKERCEKKREDLKNVKIKPVKGHNEDTCSDRYLSI